VARIEVVLQGRSKTTVVLEASRQEELSDYPTETMIYNHYVRWMIRAVAFSMYAIAQAEGIEVHFSFQPSHDSRREKKK
jgi:hypothetical protein